MTDGETRFALLVGLAWELRRRFVGSFVALPAEGEPVLYVSGRDGRRLAVLATQHRTSWVLLWERQITPADQLDLAAGKIATSVRRRPAA